MQCKPVTALPTGEKWTFEIKFDAERVTIEGGDFFERVPSCGHAYLLSHIIHDWREGDPAYCGAKPQVLTEETLRYFSDKPGFSLGQMSWYQRARAQYGMFIKREFPTVLEECFQTPIEGAIYAEIIDRLRAEGAIRQAVVDASSLVHTAWDLGSPLDTVT